MNGAPTEAPLFVPPSEAWRDLIRRLTGTEPARGVEFPDGGSASLVSSVEALYFGGLVPAGPSIPLHGLYSVVDTIPVAASTVDTMVTRTVFSANPVGLAGNRFPSGTLIRPKWLRLHMPEPLFKVWRSTDEKPYGCFLNADYAGGLVNLWGDGASAPSAHDMGNAVSDWQPCASGVDESGFTEVMAEKQLDAPWMAIYPEFINGSDGSRVNTYLSIDANFSRPPTTDGHNVSLYLMMEICRLDGGRLEPVSFRNAARFSGWPE